MAVCPISSPSLYVKVANVTARCSDVASPKVQMSWRSWASSSASGMLERKTVPGGGGGSPECPAACWPDSSSFGAEMPVAMIGVCFAGSSTGGALRLAGASPGTCVTLTPFTNVHVEPAVMGAARSGCVEEGVSKTKRG